MPKRTARTTFVTVTHAKTKATGLVPLSALKHYEARGWKAESKEVKAAEAIEAEAAKADETATADSKKNTTPSK